MPQSAASADHPRVTSFAEFHLDVALFLALFCDMPIVRIRF
jgi:hypothetical protein